MQEIKLNDFDSLKSAKLFHDSSVTIIIHGFSTNFSEPRLSTQVLKNGMVLIMIVVVFDVGINL